MDFETQIKFFTEQLTELIEGAREQASLDFDSERQNHEQAVRVLQEEARGYQIQAETAGALAQEWEQKYLTLQSKLSALV